MVKKKKEKLSREALVCTNKALLMSEENGRLVWDDKFMICYEIIKSEVVRQRQTLVLAVFRLAVNSSGLSTINCISPNFKQLRYLQQVRY